MLRSTNHVKLAGLLGPFWQNLLIDKGVTAEEVESIKIAYLHSLQICHHHVVIYQVDFGEKGFSYSTALKLNRVCHGGGLSTALELNSSRKRHFSANFIVRLSLSIMRSDEPAHRGSQNMEFALSVTRLIKSNAGADSNTRLSRKPKSGKGCADRNLLTT